MSLTSFKYVKASFVVSFWALLAPPPPPTPPAASPPPPPPPPPPGIWGCPYLQNEEEK